MRGPMLWPSPCPVSAGRVGAAVTSRAGRADVGNVSVKTDRMRSLLPVIEHGHWPLWSRDRVVVPEDNDLAGEDALDLVHISSVFSVLSLRRLGPSTGRPRK